MNAQQRHWSEQHKILRGMLEKLTDVPKALDLFMQQHATVHRSEVAEGSEWSYADEIWDGYTEEMIRYIPPKGEHSIAWNIWHLALIEDMTMNILVANSAQVFDDWVDKLNSPIIHSGNEMSPEQVMELSEILGIDALRGYRLAVGKRTREIVRELDAEILKARVDNDRLQCLYDEGVVIPEASAIIDYWRRRTVAGLLLMPPTRHCMVHLNECSRIKAKYLKSR